MELVQSSPNTPDGVTIQLNSSGQLEVINYGYNVPLGSIIAWAKSLAGVPAIPAGWVECNGQVLNDPLSLLDGTTIPNLNASGGGTKRFLRGSTTSGTTGGTETHSHSTAVNVAEDTESGAGGTDAAARGTYGSSSESTLPSYYEVVFIMRVL